MSSKTALTSGTAQNAATKKCDCGESHTETDELLESLGIPETVVVSTTVPPVHAWEVPRAYVIKHGISSASLPGLADKYGWKQLR